MSSHFNTRRHRGCQFSRRIPAKAVDLWLYRIKSYISQDQVNLRSKRMRWKMGPANLFLLHMLILTKTLYFWSTTHTHRSNWVKMLNISSNLSQITRSQIFKINGNKYRRRPKCRTGGSHHKPKFIWGLHLDRYTSSVAVAEWKRNMLMYRNHHIHST